jgi:hypothetical protein
VGMAPRCCAPRRQHIIDNSSLRKLSASGIGADLARRQWVWRRPPLWRLDGMAPSCTTSAPFVMAPTSRVRFENSFVEESDETLASPKVRFCKKYPQAGLFGNRSCRSSRLSQVTNESGNPFYRIRIWHWFVAPTNLHLVPKIMDAKVTRFTVTRSKRVEITDAM